MNMVIQSFDNLHDNRVLRYCADFEAHSLHMDTQTGAGEKVSLHFTDLLGVLLIVVSIWEFVLKLK